MNGKDGIFLPEFGSWQDELQLNTFGNLSKKKVDVCVLLPYVKIFKPSDNSRQL